MSMKNELSKVVRRREKNMRNSRFFTVGLFFFLIAVMSSEALTDKQVQKVTNASLVQIIATHGDGARYRGSGFFITSSLVVTNYHVVRHAIMVEGRDHRTGQTVGFTGASVIDASADIAILVVGNYTYDNPLLFFMGNPIALGSSNTVYEKQKIYAAGYPRGKYKFTKGKVISTKGSVNCESQDFTISRNMISPGSSGGPVLNTQGEVVGIAVAGLSIQRSIFGFSFDVNLRNYAIHIDLLKNWGFPASPSYSFPVMEPWASACTLQRSGDSLLSHGHYLKAFSAYDSAIHQNADLVEAYIGRALSKYKLNWPRDAVIEDLNTALRKVPTPELTELIQKLIRAL